jgi:hypothetical protein
MANDFMVDVTAMPVIAHRREIRERPKNSCRVGRLA